MKLEYNLIDNKIIKTELNIKKQLKKYQIIPAKKQEIKKYTDKYFKSQFTNKQKLEKLVEFEILPDELKTLLKYDKKIKENLLVEDSKDSAFSEGEDESIADGDDDYVANYEDNDDELVSGDEVQEDNYDD
ncbi:hypothetical protein COBT_000514 [Conglomerata obtusa]